MIRIEGHPNLYRDEYSGAVVNCDTLEYEKYLKMKKLKIDQRKEIESLKNEVFEIKNLLMELINESRRNNS
jgi:hypothetical protein